MNGELNTDWIKDGPVSFDDDEDFLNEVEDYRNMRKETRKTSFDYFLKGLEELIKEWEEWKEQ